MFIAEAAMVYSDKISEKVLTKSDAVDGGALRAYYETGIAESRDNLLEKAAVAIAEVDNLGNGLADLGTIRAELGLELGKGTLSRLSIGDQVFYGINAHGQDVSLVVNPISRTHAETDAFQQALAAGVSGGSGVLTVDRPLCDACGRNGAVRSMARQLGLDRLTVITPEGNTYLDLSKEIKEK